MTLTTAQYQMLLARLTALENTANNLIVAISNLVSRTQVTEVLTILQQDNAAIHEQLDALEARTTSIEEQPA